MESTKPLKAIRFRGIVIAKFPNVKAAKDWYHSEAYQSVAGHHRDGVIYQGLIVEGVGDPVDPNPTTRPRRSMISKLFLLDRPVDYA
jgi:hypothetical protein